MPTYEEILSSMRLRYRELAGCDADNASDIGIRLKVLAGEIVQLYQTAEELQRQAFAQSSTGKYLDMHAQTRGITRKPAMPATGLLRFGRENPAGADLPIPAGTVCCTRAEPRIQFETTEDAVLPAGGTQIAVPARAVTPGEPGNVAAGVIAQMITAAPGITSVTNPEPFAGGANGEPDDALRERLLKSYASISNGTNAAYYYDLAMNCEGVSSARVLPRRRGRGTVDVVVCCLSSAVQDERVNTLQQTMERQKEINVDVLVSAAAVQQTAVSCHIAVPACYDYELVAAECRRCIKEELDALEVGEALRLARLTGRLIQIDGVENCRLTLPAGDVRPPEDGVVRAGEILVERMAE